MNYFYIFSITFFVTASSLCSDKNNTIKPYTTLPIKALSVVCPLNNYAVIQQEKKFLIYNVSTREIKKEINSKGIIIAIKKHPTEALIAVLSRTTIQTHPYPTTLTIYEIPTGKEIKEISQEDLCTPILFNPFNKTLIVNTWGNILHRYNYQDNAIVPLFITPKTPMPNPTILTMARNPIKEEYIIIISFDFKQMYSMQYKMEYVFSIKKLISYDNLLPQYKKAISCIYNADGSYAAFINQHECSTLHLESKRITHPIIPSHKEDIISAAFHPINPIILATVSAKISRYNHIIVRYINILTGKIFSPINEKFEAVETALSCNNTREAHIMDFFHNGTKLFVTLYDICIVLDTPEMFLNNFYQLGTKDKCIFTNWFLAEYFKQHNSLLPYDITNFLISNILKVSEV